MYFAYTAHLICSSHILSAQQSHVASDCHTEQHISRPKKVSISGTVEVSDIVESQI